MLSLYTGRRSPVQQLAMQTQVAAFVAGLPLYDGEHPDIELLDRLPSGTEPIAVLLGNVGDLDLQLMFGDRTVTLAEWTVQLCRLPG
ncbi:MAG: hypothetical protein H7338_15420 [Candidatus Sericytochromatia bacterium]|nr:hypothetical protein [Candidatus Sericytochromatia bacterium]